MGDLSAGNSNPEAIFDQTGTKQGCLYIK